MLRTIVVAPRCLSALHFGWLSTQTVRLLKGGLRSRTQRVGVSEIPIN